MNFMVVAESQEDTDRYGHANIGSGWAANECGWCKDRSGFSRQITPRRLLDLTTSPNPDETKRAFDAMTTMAKIDIAALEAAVAGPSWSRLHPPRRARNDDTLWKSGE